MCTRALLKVKNKQISSRMMAKRIYAILSIVLLSIIITSVAGIIRKITKYIQLILLAAHHYSLIYLSFMYRKSVPHLPIFSYWRCYIKFIWISNSSMRIASKQNSLSVLGKCLLICIICENKQNDRENSNQNNQKCTYSRPNEIMNTLCILV